MMPDPPTTGVLVPTRHEAKPLLRILQGVRRSGDGELLTWEGLLEGRPVIVGLLGMGHRLAARSTRQFLQGHPVDHLILAGFGGGLDPSLRRGAVVIDRADSTGRIWSGDRLLATPEEKADVFRRTGCAVADMETPAVAAVAGEWGLGLTVIRVISDDATETFPVNLLEHGYDQERGRETPLRMLKHLIRHPAEVATLVQFLRRVEPCRKLLVEAVRSQVLEQTYLRR